MKRALFIIAFLSLAASASAQTGLPATYQVSVVPAGVANPLTAPPVTNGTLTIPYSVGICNQPLFTVPPNTVEAAPMVINWSDPVNVSPPRLCLSPQPAFFSALAPAGTATVAGYVLRISATNASGTTPAVMVSNGFSIIPPPNPPAPATGVQVRP